MPEATTCRVSVGTLRSRLKAISASLAMPSASNPNGATSFFQSSRPLHFPTSYILLSDRRASAFGSATTFHGPSSMISVLRSDSL